MPTALTETSARIPLRLRGTNAGPRKRVQMPNDERDLADTAYDLAQALSTLAQPILFRRGHIPVYPDLIRTADGSAHIGLLALTPAKARTFFSNSIEFWKAKHLADGSAREITVTLSKSEAEGLLEADQLIHHLPEIISVHARPLPIFSTTQELRMLTPGYDPESRIYTYPA